MITKKQTISNGVTKWRTIPGFPDHVVSNDGKFASRLKGGNFLSVDASGFVRFTVDGLRKKRRAADVFNAVWGGDK